MKHRFTLFLFMMLYAWMAKAQTVDTIKYCNYKGNGALAISQVSLTNWAAGGENTLATNAMVNLFADYQKKKLSWKNAMGLAYGFLNQQSIKNKKTDDKIDLSSQLGFYAARYWNYSLLFGFKTQFADGFSYPDDSTVISHFMAPGYLQLALGMEYKPNDYFSLFLSPVGARLTIVNDEKLADMGAFGVDPATYLNDTVLLSHGKKSRWEIGASLKAVFSKEIAKNVSLSSKLELFSNYLKKPQNIVVNWEVLITLKVNSFLTTNIGTQLIYDDNIDIMDKSGKKGPRTQFKEVLGVGLAYKFGK
ncbi:MAG TPA: DUF3078 domain-containing protein [Bacteroidales bacterium]